MEQYRCRSAFKLIELDDKHHIFRNGTIVVSTDSSGVFATPPTPLLCGVDTAMFFEYCSRAELVIVNC